MTLSVFSLAAPYAITKQLFQENINLGFLSYYTTYYHTGYCLHFLQRVLYERKAELGADLIPRLWLFKLTHRAELLRIKTSSEVPAGVIDHALEVHWSMTVSLLIQHVIKDRVGH